MTPPHFVIGISWHGNHNANNDHDIRVSVLWVRECAWGVLSWWLEK